MLLQREVKALCQAPSRLLPIGKCFLFCARCKYLSCEFDQKVDFWFFFSLFFFAETPADFAKLVERFDNNL